MSDACIGLERAQEIRNETPFTRWWGLEVIELGAGTAAVRLPWRGTTPSGSLMHSL